MYEGFEYMKEAIATDIVTSLIEEYKISASEALDVLYNSDTYLKLSYPQTGLYYQSSPYVYSYLKNEIATGKMG